MCSVPAARDDPRLDVRPHLSTSRRVDTEVVALARCGTIGVAGMELWSLPADPQLDRGGHLCDRDGRRVRGPRTVETGEAYAMPAAVGRRHGTAFWTAAFAFLVVMAFATLPSPLYGLYRTRDDLSTLIVTVVYAVFACGAIAALLCEHVVVARIGRRGAMLGGVATMMVAAAVIGVWKALPGLLVGRVLSGVSVGLAAGTAITYLIELRLRDDPNASVVRARTIGTSVNIGALGVGPLVAGVLAEWTSLPLTLPYVLFIALGAFALVGLAAAPETGTPNPHAKASLAVAVIPGTAAAATIAAFSATGLFAGLSGSFLATTFGRPSHALAGATLFLVFSSGVVSQLATGTLRASRVLALGMTSMLAGLTNARDGRPSLDAEPRAASGRRRADRRRRRSRLQGHDRNRARGCRPRGTSRDDVNADHHGTLRAFDSRDRSRGSAFPGCLRSQHRARLRNCCRARRSVVRTGAPRSTRVTAGGSSCHPRRLSRDETPHSVGTTAASNNAPRVRSDVRPRVSSWSLTVRSDRVAASPTFG
jgi:MFS family permease